MSHSFLNFLIQKILKFKVQNSCSQSEIIIYLFIFNRTRHATIFHNMTFQLFNFQGAFEELLASPGSERQIIIVQETRFGGKK